MHDAQEFNSLLPAARLDRRGFMLGAGALGFALAVHPVSARTVIHTDSVGLSAGEASVTLGGDALPVYFARPAEGRSLPTILVVQEIFGVHEHIRDVCRRLAKLGYLAVAPELYFRQGDPSKYDSIPSLVAELVSKVPDAQVMADLDACAQWAGANGGDAARLGITGFCWGGRISWLYAAHNPRLKAGVAWYGRIRSPASEATPKHPIDLVGQLSAPVLGLYGGQDQGIPAADAEALRDALKRAGKAGDIVIYPDAGHAFHADYRPSYRRGEAEDGWRRMTAWFKQHGL